MTLREVITEIIIPLIAGFIGGKIGNIKISKFKMNNEKAKIEAGGDVISGNKKQ